MRPRRLNALLQGGHQVYGPAFDRGRRVRRLEPLEAGSDDLFEGGPVGIVLVFKPEVLADDVHQGAAICSSWRRGGSVRGTLISSLLRSSPGHKSVCIAMVSPRGRSKASDSGLLL